jgi:formylglycine-generating enzyme required for sulfatase activity
MIPGFKMRRIPNLLLLAAVLALPLALGWAATPAAVPTPASSPAPAAVPAATRLVEMAAIPGGAFTMGSYDRYENEQPAHTVIVSPFLMAKTETTQLQYQTVTGRNPSAFRQGSLAMLHPVENVCWYDAVLYCNLLSQRENLVPCYYADESFTVIWAGQGREVWWNRTASGYRLPTEAEWEYAARGGSREDILFPGDADAGTVAWYVANSGNDTEDGLSPDWMEAQQNWTHRVGTRQANAYGLFDMAGNVREWCWDWLGRFVNRKATDPAGAAYGNTRVLRGGSCASGPADITVSARSQAQPGVRSPLFGFRVCRNAPPQP